MVETLSISAIQEDSGRLSVLFDPTATLLRNMKPAALRVRHLKTGCRLDIMRLDGLGKVKARKGVFCALSEEDAATLEPYVKGHKAAPTYPTGKWEKGCFEMACRGDAPGEVAMKQVYGWRQGGYGYPLYYAFDGEADFELEVYPQNLTHIATGQSVPGACRLTVGKAKRVGYALNQLPQFRDPAECSKEERDEFLATVKRLA